MMSSNPDLRNRLPTDTEKDEVLVIDIVGFLTDLAKLHEAEKTGNMRLSIGLRHLANALRPYADAPVSELPSVLRQPALQRIAKRPSNRPKVALPVELESLNQDEIEKILDNDAYTKEQIAELGVQRFGISRSKLARLRKGEAQDSIRAALSHERSLDVISREARISGRARSA